MYHLTATTISKSLVIEKINLENLFIPWYSWNTANVGINQSINQSIKWVMVTSRDLMVYVIWWTTMKSLVLKFIAYLIRSK